MRTLYFCPVVSFLLSNFPRLISAVWDWTSTILRHTMWPYECEFRMHVWNQLHAARWNIGRKKSPKNRHLRTIVQLCPAISSQLRHVSTIGKNSLHTNISPTCSYNIVNFGPLAAEIISLVWGTPATFNNGFRILAALLHGTLEVGVSQTLRRRTEGVTYIWQGGHHVRHWPTFQLVRYQECNRQTDRITIAIPRSALKCISQ